LIGTRRKTLLNQQPEVDQNYYKPQNFMDQMISLGRQMPDEEIKDECYTMVAGGSESTALAVAYSVLLMAMHPEVQEKAAQEAAEFLKLHDAVTAEDLNHLPYLDLVIKETLRLTTVIPLIGREAMQDFDLGPCVLKPGMIVCINLFSLHRSREVWGDDAEQFRPERFLDTAYDPNAFIPFSSGVRNCVGQRYAMLSVKVILVSLLNAFKFSTELKLADLKFAFTISMKLRNKHWVKLEARQ
jgi:docosahexaenoic acid omega-hydroxylase